MGKINIRLKKATTSPIFIPLVLLSVAIITYGVMIPWLGIYSDDWQFLFFADQTGPAGLAHYFSTNRPIWGWLYQVTAPLLGSTPWHIHVFALVTRWLAALSLWWVISLAWPAERNRLAFWSALLFTVYPGFLVQYIAYCFGSIFLVMAFFFASLGCSIMAVRQPKYFWLYTIPAVALSAANLFMMEYFFALEVLRPILVYIVLSEQTEGISPRLKKTLWVSIPYAITLAGALIWRVFFFTNQTLKYPITFLPMLKSNPADAILYLLKTILVDLWNALLLAWGNLFTFPNKANASTGFLVVYAAAIFASAAVCAGSLLLHKNRTNTRIPWSYWFVCLVALLVAGLPFWLTGLEVRPDWANDRFTMPYMAGASLFVAGAIGALANRRRVAEALLVVLVAAGTGLQVNNANLYRIDWAQQKELVWQMDWRIPALQPGTLVLINDQGGMANSPTYLSYVFNWIYAQDNHTNHLSLFPTYPQYILNKLNTSNGDAAIHTANEGADFTGSKKDVLSLYYTNKCLAILDPQVDIYNPLLTSEEKSMAALSNPSLIITDPAQHVRMPTNIFGSELPKDDCYWYQQADLARQAADWQGAARIGDDHLNMERVNYRTLWIPLPYIESYAHLNQWKRSADLTHQLVQLVAGQTGQKMDARPMLCSLWRRMAATTSDSPEKQSALQAVVPDLNCNIP